MKKIITILSAAVLLAGCSSGGGNGAAGETGLSNEEYTPPVLATYEGWKLTDKDGKRATGEYNESDYARTGTTYTVTADDCKNPDGTVNYGFLPNKVESLQSGDTLILDGSKGTFYSKTITVWASGITIKGASSSARPVIDFSPTYGTITKAQIQAAVEAVKAWYPKNNGVHYIRSVSTEYNEFGRTLGNGKGLYVKTSWNVIEDLVLCNASDSGLKLYRGGSTQSVNNNLVKNVEVYGCGNSGVDISEYSTTPVDCCEEFDDGGPSNNKFFNCYSHDNFDPWNLGENADGFAVKAGSGDGNYFENCIAEYNSDDGWDCYRIRGSTTWVNCIARYNGINSQTKKVWAEFANGNGFKVGGGATSGGTVNGVSYPDNSPSLHRHAQYLKNCIAYGNRGNSGVGFDRNNQYGSVYLENCWSTDNRANLTKWGSTTYERKNYRMGSYGNNIYVKDCYLGQEGEPYDLGYCDGVVNTVAGVK